MMVDCAACEGRPSPENTPCAVCGRAPVDDGLVERVVKEGLSVATLGTPDQVQFQIAINVAKAAFALAQSQRAAPLDRDGIVTVVEPIIDRVPMVDASQARIRNIRAGWIADAIMQLLTASAAR